MNEKDFAIQMLINTLYSHYCCIDDGMDIVNNLFRPVEGIVIIWDPSLDVIQANSEYIVSDLNNKYDCLLMISAKYNFYENK